MKSLKQSGFTIVEIMIVMAIIGIIASIAIPSYTDYLQKAASAEATSTLADMRIQMEQYYQDNRTYAGSDGAGLPCAGSSGQKFSFACSGIGADAYRITATGSGNVAGFSFTVDQDNARTSVFDGNSGNCWLTSKTGSC